MKDSYRKIFLKLFPPPRFLSMPSVGVDISDTSLKFIELKNTKHGIRIGRFGEESIPPGVVVSGKIKKVNELVSVLAKICKDNDINFVRATLPEESGYLFEILVPSVPEDELTGAIEFRLEENVPVIPSEAVFGFDLLPISGKKRDEKREKRRAVVSVFPRTVTEMYAGLFSDAGMKTLSLEMEPQAIMRSIIPRDDMGTYLILDFGRKRSGVSIVSEGAVRFATTIDAGGDSLTRIFTEHFKDLSEDEIVDLKNSKGLRAVREENDSQFTEQIEIVIDSLLQSIQKHLRYWNTHGGSDKSKHLPIKKVFLCGGNANFNGLAERISQELKIPAVRSNVWVNVFSLDDHIPDGISFSDSLGYAPAIGLALHGINPVMRNRHMANLLPPNNLTLVRQERRRRIISVWLMSTLVVALMATAFLVPSIILSQTKVVASERKIDITKKFIQQREDSGILVEVRGISERLERLDKEIDDIKFSVIFESINKSILPGISLTNISYTRVDEDVDVLSIRGNAATRDVLLSFTRRLGQEKMFGDVDLPVSNLAQSKDILFSISFTAFDFKQQLEVESNSSDSSILKDESES